jgi:hypothetical protein
MPAEIKAVVIKTPRLFETKNFYTHELGLKIIESSGYHFVIRSTGIRIVFMSVNHDVEVEMYLSQNIKNDDIKIIEDVNRIRFVVCGGDAGY